jgi:hypothetical protein
MFQQQSVFRFPFQLFVYTETFFLFCIFESFQESSLKQVMDQESEIIRDTQSLHSDMQTLVYENYNKFISATDTIRKVLTSVYILLFHFCLSLYLSF